MSAVDSQLPKVLARLDSVEAKLGILADAKDVAELRSLVFRIPTLPQFVALASAVLLASAGMLRLAVHLLE